jgi:hypothetical protein
VFAVLLSVFVMASRPWGCSATSESPVVTCDWITSRVVAAIWLATGLAICLVAWKRWKLPLAIISALLLPIGLVSAIGVFVLTPAALWFGCAMWLWTEGRPSRLAWGAVVTIALLYLAIDGVIASFALYFTPI